MPKILSSVEEQINGDFPTIEHSSLMVIESCIILVRGLNAAA